MESVLRAIYKLQQLDLELDELDEGGEELESEVADLQKQVDEQTAAIKAEEGNLQELRKTRSDSNIELQELRDRLHKLNERLRTVRNNKEYDATTAEIATVEQDIHKIEHSHGAWDSEEAGFIRNIETLSKEREETTGQLEERRETLSTLRSTHADEVQELRKTKEEVLGEVDPDLLKRYEHIRTAYSDAVVKVRKGACSGCYRAITPQTIVEMRRSERIYMCEHCGRILIDEDMAESVSIL